MTTRLNFLPRFTLNAFATLREEAKKLIRNFSLERAFIIYFNYYLKYFRDFSKEHTHDEFVRLNLSKSHWNIDISARIFLNFAIIAGKI